MRSLEEICGVETAEHIRKNDPNLTILEIRGGRPCPDISDDEMQLLIEELSKNSFISTLILAENSISDNGLIGIEKLENIETLDLLDNLLSDNSLKYIMKMPKLHTLDLSGNKITIAGLNFIFENGKLLKGLFLTDELEKLSIPATKIPSGLKICVNGIEVQNGEDLKSYMSEKIIGLLEDFKKKEMLTKLDDYHKKDLVMIFAGYFGVSLKGLKQMEKA